MTRRGMATVIVIVLIGVLAAVLTAVAAGSIAQQRRAAMAGEEIQASRLLAAAAQIAQLQLSHSATADGPLETPIGHIILAWRGEAASRVCVVNIDVGHVRREMSLAFEGGRLAHVE